MAQKTPKPRNPFAHARSAGATRTRVIADKRAKTGRKAKHKGGAA